MTCKEIQEMLLTDYYDGQLSDSEKERIDGHLKDCKRCREFLEAVKQVDVSMEPSHHMAEVSPHVWQTILQRIDEQKRLSFVGLWERVAEWFPPTKILVPITACVFIAVFLTQHVLAPKQKNTDKTMTYIEETLQTFSVNGDSDNTLSFGSDVEMYFL